jgi:hypothetical protein
MFRAQCRWLKARRSRRAVHDCTSTGPLVRVNITFDCRNLHRDINGAVLLPYQASTVV